MDQHRYFVEIRVGGLAFAVEAQGIRDVADAAWVRPDEENEQDEKVYLRLNLAEVLELPPGVTSRVLVIDGPAGITGFGVDNISKEIIKQTTITPVPPILLEWMKYPVLSGFTKDSTGSLLQILDMLELARIASLNQAPDEGKGNLRP